MSANLASYHSFIMLSDASCVVKLVTNFLLTHQEPRLGYSSFFLCRLTYTKFYLTSIKQPVQLYYWLPYLGGIALSYYYVEKKKIFQINSTSLFSTTPHYGFAVLNSVARRAKTACHLDRVLCRWVQSTVIGATENIKVKTHCVRATARKWERI